MAVPGAEASWEKYQEQERLKREREIEQEEIRRRKTMKDLANAEKHKLHALFFMGAGILLIDAAIMAWFGFYAGILFLGIVGIIIGIGYFKAMD
jgi:hypothetical protein